MLYPRYILMDHHVYKVTYPGGEAVASLKPGAGGGGAEGAGGARRGCSCKDNAMASSTIVSSSASGGMSSRASKPKKQKYVIYLINVTWKVYIYSQMK